MSHYFQAYDSNRVDAEALPSRGLNTGINFARKNSVGSMLGFAALVASLLPRRISILNRFNRSAARRITFHRRGLAIGLPVVRLVRQMRQTNG